VEVSPTAAGPKRAGLVVLSTGDVRIPVHPPEPSVRARREDQTYRPPAGDEELRTVVADRAGVRPDDVVVTPGARQALLLTFAALDAARPELLVSAPYWVSYPHLAAVAGRTATVLPGEPGTLDVRALRDACGAATGAVVVNSPRNPDGMVVDERTLAELVEWTADAGLVLVFDQVYRDVPLGSRAASPLDLPGGLPEHCVVVDGVAKSHALAGLRVGWVVTRGDRARRLTALASHVVGGVSSQAQDTALATLRAPVPPVLGETLRSNLAYALDRLRSVPGVTCAEPGGGIFLFPDLRGWLARAPLTADSVVASLDTDHGVAVVDGAAFGAPGHVRLSFAVDAETLRGGIERLVGAITGGAR
jgi:aspartate aminotransferase